MTETQELFTRGAFIALVNRLVGLGLDPVAVIAVIHAEAVNECIRLAGHGVVAEMLDRCAGAVRADADAVPDTLRALAMMPVAGRA